VRSTRRLALVAEREHGHDLELVRERRALDLLTVSVRRSDLDALVGGVLAGGLESVDADDLRYAAGAVQVYTSPFCLIFSSSYGAMR
jgi:hypothetical protein